MKDCHSTSLRLRASRLWSALVSLASSICRLLSCCMLLAEQLGLLASPLAPWPSSASWLRAAMRAASAYSTGHRLGGGSDERGRVNLLATTN